MATVTRALKHRNYRLFFSGQLISVVGTWMQTVAESWLVYRLTGSSALLGVTAFATQVPFLVFATLGGTVADRFDRHRVIIMTQAASMVLPLILGVLTLTGRVQVWHVLVLATCLGIVNSFDMPARQSFLVEMVGREDLGNAIALNSSMFNGARVVGPAAAGLLVAALGEGWCFVLNGVSYLAVIGGLLLMRFPPRAIGAAENRPRPSTADGYRFALQTAPMRAILLFVGAIGLFGTPYLVLMPVFAEGILHGGPRALGLLTAATGLGALGGALSLAQRRGVVGLGRWAATAAAAFGLLVMAFAFSRTFWLSAALLVPAGTGLMVLLAACNTLIQSMVPDALRGRVMAIYSMMLMGMSPFGALAAGALAERIGAPYTTAICGGLSVVIAAVFASRLPHLREEARELIAAQGLSGGS